MWGSTDSSMKKAWQASDVCAPRLEEGGMKSEKTFRQRGDPWAASFAVSDPETVQREAQQMQQEIACRAYELFEARNREHGHDREDWFRAELEFLRPVSVVMTESEQRLSIHAGVFGFDRDELKVSIEPRHIIIVGRKQGTEAETEGGKRVYIDWYPNKILRVIDLAVEVDPVTASVELQSGTLKFELPKAAARTGEPPAHAA